MRRVLIRTPLAALIITTLLIAGTNACAGKTPLQVAGSVAQNGTILVDVVEKVGDFVIAQEEAKRIPRNESVDAMKSLVKALDAAKIAHGHLVTLSKLPGGDTSLKPLVQQLQDALTIVASQVGQSLIPVGDPAIRKQIGDLALEVNKTIGSINAIVLARLVKE